MVPAFMSARNLKKVLMYVSTDGSKCMGWMGINSQYERERKMVSKEWKIEFVGSPTSAGYNRRQPQTPQLLQNSTTSELDLLRRLFLPIPPQCFNEAHRGCSQLSAGELSARDHTAPSLPITQSQPTARNNLLDDLQYRARMLSPQLRTALRMKLS